MIRPRELFKSAITHDSKKEIFKFFESTIQYFKCLSIDGKNASERVAFLGFIVNMTNVINIYEEYMITNRLECIPTFALSQDVLETLFSRIRGLNGNNDNPSIDQLISALRKLLVHNEIVASENANCKDQLKILKIPSTQRESSTTLVEFPSLNDIVQNDSVFEDIADSIEFELDIYCEASVSFISAQIEKTIKSGVFDCDTCITVLEDNDKISDDILIPQLLQRPTASTFYICRISEKYFQIFKKSLLFDYKVLLGKILENIDRKNVFPKSNFECDEIFKTEHKEIFIKCIVEEYLRIRATNIAKDITIDLQKDMYRKKATKLYQFRGQ